MKKWFLRLFAFLLLVCLVPAAVFSEGENGAAEETYIPVERVSVNYKTLRLQPGETGVRLEAEVRPENADCVTVHWVSSDESVVRVDADGRVTAVAAGKAAITCVSDADEKKTARTEVTVLQPVTGISIEDVPDELPKGKNWKLSATVEPADASNKKVVWESSDRSVVYIINGVLATRNTGVAVLSCLAEDGSGVGDAKLIEVYEPVESVRLVSMPVKVYTGTDVTLTASVKPQNAKYGKVVWSSSDESIAAVDEYGVLTPLKPGTVTITAEAEGKKAKARIKVERPVTSLTLDREDESVPKGEKIRLQYTVEPADATNPKVVWESSDPKVATVQNGTVTARKGGTAVITATAPGGNDVRATYTVKVLEKATDIRFEENRLAAAVGHTTEPVLSLLPEGANDLALTWTSADASIASIDPGTGLITGNKAGLTEITVKDAVSGKSAKVKVLVEPEIPLSVEKFTRSGQHEAYSEFSLQIKNQQAVRSLTGIGFTLVYDCAGEERSFPVEYTFNSLPPSKETKAGPWYIGYQLTYSKDFKVYLNSARYSDGTTAAFPEGTLLGVFE